MTPNECKCNCEPKCCPDECCKGLGDECQCKNKAVNYWQDEELKPDKKTIEFEPDMDLTIHQMVTHKEFIQAYSNKSDGEIRKCVVCGETNSSFIDSTNMLEVVFHCHEHWMEKEGKKSPSSINRSLSDEI